MSRIDTEIEANKDDESLKTRRALVDSTLTKLENIWCGKTVLDIDCGPYHQGAFHPRNYYNGPESV